MSEARAEQHAAPMVTPELVSSHGIGADE